MRKLRNDELGRINKEEYASVEKTPIIVILDNIRSANNVGSVFRTSDAFLIEEIYLCGITATPPNKDIQKTALGAQDSVPWKYSKTTEETVSILKEKGYKIFAIEQVEQSIMLQNFEFPDSKIAVVFGNEVKGVDQKIVDQCDGTIEIPQFGTKHSFNISVSCGIVLWELHRKLRFHENNL